MLSRFICAPAASCRQKGAKICRYALILSIPLSISFHTQSSHIKISAPFFILQPHPLLPFVLSVTHYQSTRSLPSFNHHHTRSLHFVSFSEAQAGFVQLSRQPSSDRQHKHTYLLHSIEDYSLDQDEAQHRHSTPTSRLRLQTPHRPSSPSPWQIFRHRSRHSSIWLEQRHFCLR